MSVLDAKCPACGAKRAAQARAHKSLYKEYAKRSASEKRRGARIKEECPECKSPYLYYYAMQVRSADEGQTVFYECDCGYKTKFDT